MNVGKARVSGQVSVLSAASTPVLDADVSRLKATFVNDGANIIYLQYATDGNDPPVAVAGQGIRLNANGGSHVEDNYTGAVAAIALVANTNLCIVEL